MRDFAAFAVLAIAALMAFSVAAREDVVNGSKADPKEFPWVVKLSRRNDSDPVCSGALIRATWVLTARHCLNHIREGDHVRFPLQPPAVIKRAIPFDEAREGDIALIELEARVAVNVVAIGPAPGIGVAATIIGFGEDEEGTTGVLRQASVQVVSGEHCAGSGMTHAMLCVGHTRAVVCVGDSGGPLLAGGRLVAIANRIDPTRLCGPAPAGGFRVSAFARADVYAGWIDQTISRDRS